MWWLSWLRRDWVHQTAKKVSSTHQSGIGIPASAFRHWHSGIDVSPVPLVTD
jgi:hypothetical protein